MIIRKVQGLVTVQDAGRPGHASEGVPRGGALSRRLLRAANAAVGNPEDAPCIEVIGRVVISTEVDVNVTTERGDLTSLVRGAELTVDPRPDLRARYVAIAGGIDVPRVLGSASTLVGCFGSALRAGDTVAVGSAVRRSPARTALASADAPVRVASGPDDPASFAAFVRTRWRVDPASDRRGTRLVALSTGGPTSRGNVLPSSPTVVGAVQLPAGGSPIVIGPDGPTTGGYPIIAVILREDVDRFHELPLGSTVAFAGATLA